MPLVQLAHESLQKLHLFRPLGQMQIIPCQIVQDYCTKIVTSRVRRRRYRYDIYIYIYIGVYIMVFQYVYIYIDVSYM